MSVEADLDNRRQLGRVPARPSHVTINGLANGTVTAVVLDESFGGIGVLSPVEVPVGSEVDCTLSSEQGGIRAVAYVRNVTPQSEGARIGLEWKAQALSRNLRLLLSAKDVPDRLQALVRVLPGGISIMWKLFEAQEWQQLLFSSERLRKESAACYVHSLIEPIEEFQEVLRQSIEKELPDIKKRVETALTKLINQCIDLII